MCKTINLMFCDFCPWYKSGFFDIFLLNTFLHFPLFYNRQVLAKNVCIEQFSSQNVATSVIIIWTIPADWNHTSASIYIEYHKSYITTLKSWFIWPCNVLLQAYSALCPLNMGNIFHQKIQYDPDSFFKRLVLWSLLGCWEEWERAIWWSSACRTLGKSIWHQSLEDPAQIRTAVVFSDSHLI